MAKERCWLVKSEPDCFSIEHLAAAPKQTTFWDGVRNYQARNFMRDMKQGDRLLYYHSGGDAPAVAGTAVVAREAYPDHTAWDPHSDHYDPKASPANPIWQMVDVQLDSIFPAAIPLATLRAVPALKSMELLKRGSRLSVQPVTPAEFDAVLALASMTTSAKPSKVAKRVKSKPARKTAGSKRTAAQRSVAKKRAAAGR